VLSGCKGHCLHIYGQFNYRTIGEKNTLVEQELRHHQQAVAKNTPNETINETEKRKIKQRHLQAVAKNTPNETINETERRKIKRCLMCVHARDF